MPRMMSSPPPPDGEKALSPEEDRPSGDGAPQALEGLHILVVDDEVDARDLFAMVLRYTRAHVSVAGNVDEALRVFVSDRPDLLVSDIGMPGEDGYSLIRRVRRLSAEAGGAVPALALTAFTGPENRARALEAGFTEHLPKPVDPDRLIEVVTRLALAR